MPFPYTRSATAFSYGRPVGTFDCEPYQVAFFPWTTFFPDGDVSTPDPTQFYNNPAQDGVTLNLNLGGYYDSWVGSTTPNDPLGAYTNLINNPYAVGVYKVDGGAYYYDSYYGDTYLDLWAYTGYFDITDSVALSRYSVIGGSADGTVNPLPGWHQYPGVASYSGFDSFISPRNYGYPIICEIWYSLNPARTNTLVGWNNYSFFGDQPSSALPNVNLANAGAYVKSYYAGAFKVTADMYSPVDSDFLCGVSYVGNDTGGVLKIIINGIVVQTATVAEKVFSINADWDTIFEGLPSFIGTGKSNCDWIQIQVTTASGSPYLYQDNGIPDGSPDFNTGIFDTYQCKFAFMIDTDTGLPAGTQDTNTSSYIWWYPGAFYTLPNTVLPCAPSGSLPDYTPPPPIVNTLDCEAWARLYQFKDAITPTTDPYGFINGASMDNDGSVIAIGAIADAVEYATIVKFGKYGNIEWQRYVGLGGEYTNYYSFTNAIDTANNIYVLCQNDADVLVGLLKFNSSGSLLLQKEYLLEAGVYNIHDIITVSDGLLILANVYKIAGGGGTAGRGVCILKIDFSGNIVWKKLRTTSVNSNYHNMCTIGNTGQFYVWSTISTLSSGVQTLGRIDKYDESGNFLWSKEITTNVYTNSYNLSAGIVALSTGEFYIGRMLGVVSSTPPYVSTYYMSVMKFTADGNLMWIKRMPAENGTYPYSMKTDGTSVYIYGDTAAAAGSGAILKINTATDQIDYRAYLNNPENSGPTSWWYGSVNVMGDVRGNFISIAGWAVDSSVVFKLPKNLENYAVDSPLEIASSPGFSVLIDSVSFTDTITSDFSINTVSSTVVTPTTSATDSYYSVFLPPNISTGGIFDEFNNSCLVPPDAAPGYSTPYWHNVYGNDYPVSVFFTEGNNIQSMTFQGYLTTFDYYGNTVSQKKLNITTTAANSGVVLMTKNSADEIYVVTYTFTYSPTGNDKQVYLTKLDAAQNIVWQKKITSIVSEIAITNLEIDTAGNVYAVGYNSKIALNTENYKIIIYKFDSSGNNIFQRYIDPQIFSGTGTRIDDVKILFDSSQNMYVCAAVSPWASVTRQIVVFKISTTGVLGWAKAYGCTPNALSNMSLTIDNENYIYFGRSNVSGRSNKFYLTKISTVDGSKVFENAFQLASTYEFDSFGAGGTIISDGDFLYLQFIYYIDSLSKYAIMFMKFDKLGTILWQKLIHSDLYELYATAGAQQRWGNFTDYTRTDLVLNVAKHFNSSLTGSVVIKMPKTGTMGNTYCDLTFDPTARFSPITESVVTSVDATVVLSTIAHTITDSTTVSIVDQAAPTVAHCNYTDVEIPYIPSPSSINWPSSITFQYYVPVPTNDQYFDFPGTQTPAVDVAATLQATQTGSGIWEGSVVAYPPIFVSPTANIRGRWPYTSWNSQATLVWPTSPGTSYSNYFEFSQTALNGTPSAVRLWQGFLQYFTTDWGTTIGSGPATYNQTIYTSPGTEWLGIVPSGTQWYRKITYSIATDVQQKDPPYSPGEYFHKATGTITTNFYNPTDFTNMVVPVFLSSGFPSIVTLKYAPSGVYQGYTKTYKFNTATTISNTPGATYT